MISFLADSEMIEAQISRCRKASSDIAHEVYNAAIENRDVGIILQKYGDIMLDQEDYASLDLLHNIVDICRSSGIAKDKAGLVLVAAVSAAIQMYVATCSDKQASWANPSEN